MKRSVLLSSAVASNSGNGRPTEVPDYHSSFDLPLDIVIDILSRLPVKTLIGFKSVSKHWNDIISSNPYFVSMHLIRNQQSANHIVCTYKDRYDDDDNQIRTAVVSCPDDPILVYFDQHSVICSSGDLGVLLLQWKDPMPSSYQFESEYALWNPATRQVKLLFRPPFEPPSTTTYFPNYNPEEFEFDEYNLFAPHWEQYNDEYGVGLDLVANDHLYCPVSGPHIYRDSIAVFATTISSVDVWLLSGGSNEGVGELSWIKHDSIIAPNLPRELGFCEFWTDDKLFAGLDENGKSTVVVFDTRKQQVKVLLPDVFLQAMYTYKETLVCIQ
ncbi:F-box only protein 8 [Linum grandiflorum]